LAQNINACRLSIYSNLIIIYVRLDLGLLFLFIFLIFSAFSHEKTGTRWFGGGAEEEQLEGLVDFPTTRPKLPWNCLVAKCPIIAFWNRIICNLTANLNRYRYNKLIYSISLLFLFVYTPRKSGFFIIKFEATLLIDRFRFDYHYRYQPPP
jgi:hypothetical protein